MKVNPSQTRSLDRIIDQQLGSGTSILTEGSAVKLIPGEKDQIQISQLGSRLQILVNGSEKFLLTERESQSFILPDDQKNILIDQSVSIFSTPQNIPKEAQATLPSVSAPRQEHLGHARRVESTFETAVTRGMITEDLKEDGFITHVGKQMQRLLGEMGATIQQQTAFRTEKDLLPFLKQFDAAIANPKSSATAFPRNFLQDLTKTTQQIQQQINNGEPVQLEFLGAQVSRGLSQVIKPKTSSQMEMQPGSIPFELHEIPVGESHRGAFQKWAMINEAINKNDAQMIGAFAGDRSLLKIALPAEKGAFIKVLASEADSISNQHSIIGILQSAENSGEFKSIINMAGPKLFQDVFKENAGMFNITAHIFQSPELALDQKLPSFAGNEYVRAFSPHQIFIEQNFAEDPARFSENPIALSLATPDEKASMIQQLQTGYVSTADNRSIINVLQSTMNKTEFDQIVDSAGGKTIGLSLQDPVSLMQWNRLAGAYDRMDLTTDFVEGVKYSGALLESFPFELTSPISPSLLKAPTILRDQFMGDVSGFLNTFMKDASAWIGNQIGGFDRGAYVQAGLENLNRMMGEFPLINIPLMRNELSAILQQPNLNSQQILNHFENLITSSGLTGYDLRNLISQPLAFIYNVAANEASTLGRNVMAFVQENLEFNVFQYGPKSLEAKLVEGQLPSLQKTFLPFVERLQFVSNLLSEAFPPPPDFITSLSKFTSALNQNIVPNLSNVLPDVSATAARIFENAQTIEELANGKYSISALTSPTIPTAPEITQVRSYLTNVTDGLEKIRSGNLVREFSRVEQGLLHVADMPKDLIQFTKQATSFFSSIQDGSYARALKDVAATLKDDDPIAELTKTTAYNGAAFLSQLHDGSFTRVHNEYIKELDNFQNNPGVLKLNQFFEKLSSLTKGLISDSDTANITNDSLGLISEVAGNELRGSLTNIVKAATVFRNSPTFRKLAELLDGSAKFFAGLSQGNFVQNMEMMNSRFGYSPAVAQVIERGLHLSTTGSNVLKTLIVRDFERPIAQLTRKAQAKTQSAKEIIDAENVFSTAAIPFFALTEVNNMDRMWHYHRQLDLINEKNLIDPTFRQFEKQIQLLAAEPELKKSLQKQFNSFQNLNRRNL